jgi:hypothetical protein
MKLGRTAPVSVHLLTHSMRACLALTLCTVISVVQEPHAATRVLIVAGQSNAVGYGANANTLPPVLYSPQRDVPYEYNIGGLPPVTDFVWLKWLNGGSGVSLYSKFCGPELSLGRGGADAFPDSQFLVVKVAVNGTSLCYDWDPNRSGSLYGVMTQAVRTAMAGVAARGGTSVVAGYFWMQGESDAASPDCANAYNANLTAFITRVRSEFGQPALPFVLGRISSRIPIESFPYRQIVQDAQAAVADADPFTEWVNTDALSLIFDSLHFDTQGEVRLGGLFARAYVNLVAAPRIR